MSQQKTCPYCNRFIRLRDKFCPFCGRNIMQAPNYQNMYSRVSQPGRQAPQAPPTRQPPAEIPPVSPPPSGEQPSPFVSQTGAAELEPLSEDVIDQIALRVELEQLDSSMAEIRSKLEELGEMISKIEVTHDIEEKIKNFKNQIKEIKIKRENLNAEKRDLPFEADLTKKQEVKDRLAKLNDAYRSKKVTESAFKKLRTEYEQTLQEIDAKSRNFKAKINIWLKKVKTDRNAFQEKLELLEARFAAGEMGQDTYNDEKTEYEEKVKKFNDVLKYLSGKL